MDCLLYNVSNVNVNISKCIMYTILHLDIDYKGGGMGSKVKRRVTTSFLIGPSHFEGSPLGGNVL